MFLETNKLSANAETLAPWGQLRHGLVGGNFQVVKKLNMLMVFGNPLL
jgi:hypothetical protein